MRKMLFIVLMTTLFAFDAFSYSRYSGNASNEEQKLFFIMPSDGEIVKSPVRVKFGIEGMEIVPAGVDKPMSGHHHLLINLKKLPNMKMPIPADKNHLHFGKGQTETQLELPKGKHTLQLLLGNHLHIPHDKPLISEKIEITVE
ncbi:MAG: rod shape-determining protein RodA [Flavobacteriales bacterium]|nr:rod shape-determining protein RodA [Flavobacteriales bacterium]